MEFNYVTQLNSCWSFLQMNKQDGLISFIYYSHIPAAVVSVLLGAFVFLKSRKDIAVKLFFTMATLFAVWAFFDIILWTSADSRKTMFFWSLINLVENLVTAFTVYFAYVFIEKTDIRFRLKIIFASLFLPYIFLLPSIYNVTGFNATTCEANQGSMVNYFYFLEIFFFITLLIYLARKIMNTEGEEKKKVVYFSIGVILFLSSFSGANLAGSLAAVLNPNNPDNWKIIQYGLFGMPIFMGFLTYLIVKFKAFNIKLLGEQALIVAQIALISAMFAFASNTTNKILVSITLLGTAVMGVFLIRSSKKLSERKEQLQMMAGKLAQANDQLRVLDNSKTEFISIASHQLRTPLTAVKGFVSMLLEGSYGKLKPQQEDILNKVYTSNERLVNLVEDLLNVSRMESGRMEFKFAPWSVEKICKDVIDTFMLRAKDHKLSLEYDMPEQELPEVLIDGVKVREVISNLVDNALKYTLDGHGGVKLKSELLGENIRVTISDTGIGIPQTELPYLFAKFSRGKDIARLNTGGTGLGLYVGRNMIEANGGRIWAESEGQDKGSRFIIEIPIKQSEELIQKWA